MTKPSSVHTNFLWPKGVSNYEILDTEMGCWGGLATGDPCLLPFSTTNSQKQLSASCLIQAPTCSEKLSTSLSDDDDDVAHQTFQSDKVLRGQVLGLNLTEC